MKKALLSIALSTLVMGNFAFASIPATVIININNGFSPTQKDLRTTTVGYSVLLPSDATVIQGTLVGVLKPLESAKIEIQSKDPEATALGTIVQITQNDKLSHSPDVLWTAKLNYDAMSNKGNYIILQNNTNFNNWADVSFVYDIATINVAGML